MLKVTIVGNLGNDPDLRYTQTGEPVCNISVASNRKDSSGVQHVTWVRVAVWGKIGESVNQYLRKGSQVYIESYLNPDPATGGPRLWTDKSGNQRVSYEVTATYVKFLSDNNSSDSQEGNDSQNYDSTAIDEDDIPF